MCFPDGHASNILRLINLEDYKLYGMKSHDCYVFMQTLIPLAYRDLLSNKIWNALTEISHFFRDKCFSKWIHRTLRGLKQIWSRQYTNLS